MLYKIHSPHTFDDLAGILCGQFKTVYAMEKTGDQYHLARASAWVTGKHVPGDFRALEPLKGLVFKPRESLGPLLGDAAVPEAASAVAVGIKACDVSATRIHDFVFLQSEPVDGFYKETREKTAIISCDCSKPCSSCFCTMVKGQPYPKAGFDINFSFTNLGVVVETGSERGEKLMEKARHLVEKADEDVLQARDQKRQEITRQVTEGAVKNGLQLNSDYRQAISRSRESKLWEEFAKDCVECGACNFACCTCHCFLLADGLDQGKTASRVKQWDSCLYLNFARVAGNGNPRKHRAERLHNRFDKKFNFFPQVLGRYACDGCGRCIESCTGRIDIRAILKKACDEVR